MGFVILSLLFFYTLSVVFLSDLETLVIYLHLRVYQLKTHRKFWICEVKNMFAFVFTVRQSGWSLFGELQCPCLCLVSFGADWITQRVFWKAKQLDEMFSELKWWKRLDSIGLQHMNVYLMLYFQQGSLVSTVSDLS